MKKVVQLDQAGYFVGTTLADASPLEPGAHLMPAHTVDADAPNIPDGHLAKWDGAWVFEAIPEPAAPEPAAPEVVPDFATSAEAKVAATRWIDKLTGTVEDRYPSVVRYGWVDEESMAEAFVANTATDAQLVILQADADAKNRTPAEHAQRILENARAYRSIKNETRRLWLATLTNIDAVTDPFQYQVVLEAAIDEAAPLVEAYGL
jgi:hypothetical protein